MKVEAVVKINNLPRIRSTFPATVDSIFAKATFDVYDRSQISVPVRRPDVAKRTKTTPGALKNSGVAEYRKGSFEGVVRYTIYYAVYVHEGTYRMPARPWLVNALRDIEPAFMAALRSLEKRLI